MDAPTTQAEIKAAYKRLYTATANAMDAAQITQIARYRLTEAEAQNWPGGNETERKAARMSGTQEARRALQDAEVEQASTEREQALAKIDVNELRERLRLAEFLDRPLNDPLD
jgi:hypothetical protein